jgi:hypothetical protein
MSLIEQIRTAVINGQIIEPFTVEDLERWNNTCNIVQNDGTEYTAKSINSILSNSDVNNIPTSNLNKKVLESEENDNGIKEYRFI